MIYICIVTYKRDEIYRCLKGLQDLGYAGWRLCILWQGVETPRSSELAWAITDNLGCAGGRKFLAEKLLAQGIQPDDITIWLDDDLVVNGDTWLDALCTPILANDADITGVEGMEVLPTFYTQPCGTKPPHYVSGGWCAISARVFLAGCMFDTRYFPNYWEDVDLNFQAREKGFRIAQVPNEGLHHEPHPADIQAFEYCRAQFIAKWGNIGLTNNM